MAVVFEQEGNIIGLEQRRNPLREVEIGQDFFRRISDLFHSLIAVLLVTFMLLTLTLLRLLAFEVLPASYSLQNGHVLVIGVVPRPKGFEDALKSLFALESLLVQFVE
jgi:hypothetical protein